jgi:hypothetical protein
MNDCDGTFDGDISPASNVDVSPAVAGTMESAIRQMPISILRICASLVVRNLGLHNAKSASIQYLAAQRSSRFSKGATPKFKRDHSDGKGPAPNSLALDALSMAGFPRGNVALPDGIRALYSAPKTLATGPTGAGYEGFRRTRLRTDRENRWMAAGVKLGVLGALWLSPPTLIGGISFSLADQIRPPDFKLGH